MNKCNGICGSYSLDNIEIEVNTTYSLGLVFLSSTGENTHNTLENVADKISNHVWEYSASASDTKSSFGTLYLLTPVDTSVDMLLLTTTNLDLIVKLTIYIELTSFHCDDTICRSS